MNALLATAFVVVLAGAAVTTVGILGLVFAWAGPRPRRVVDVAFVITLVGAGLLLLGGVAAGAVLELGG